MKLKEILAGIPIAESHAEDTLEITGIRYDSRTCSPADLFVAGDGAMPPTAISIPHGGGKGRGGGAV